MHPHRELPELSEGQSRCLEAIRVFISKNKRAPSLNELSRALGLASNFMVRKYLDALHKKRRIVKARGPFGITVLER